MNGVFKIKTIWEVLNRWGNIPQCKSNRGDCYFFIFSRKVLRSIPRIFAAFVLLSFTLAKTL